VIRSGRLQRPFNLVKWFSILSFLSIVLISVGTAATLSRFLTANMLRRDAVVTMEFLNSIVRVEDGASYFAGDHAFEEASSELEVFFQHVAEMPDVLRANVYALDKTILWSSDSQLIGRQFSENADLSIAFRGNLDPQLEVVGESEKAEYADLPATGSRFIENYLPVWNGAGDAVVGVVEVYRAPRDLLDAISTGRALVWLSSALGGLFLFSTLFWMVRRANGLIQQQQQLLMEAGTHAVIGEMASAVAHGLRNPLASIRSSAELMLEEAPPDHMAESLEDIVSQSDRLEGWVRAFLTSVQGTPGELECIQVNDVIAESCQVFMTQMRERGINFIFRRGDDLPQVEANQTALRQVINSILANSLEAMPEGGRLVVESGYVATEQRVGVTFTDTGGGIPGHLMGEVFKPFMTTKGAGLGIGLPLAQRIVERLGGTLELNSDEGIGTSVTLSIPIAK
jgi:signal transduction histidine kinase